MITPITSVIVPVYKVEKYLSRCIDSVLSQTFTDFELLLIDDGSPDQSGQICDEYAKLDDRIRVFHKENGGVSSARNLGLDNAKGDWIAFVDADDWISEDFLQIDDHADADVIQKAYHTINEITDKVVMNPIKSYEFNKKEDIYRFFVRKRKNALWNKIISRKIIQSARFDTNIAIGEDFLFFLSIIRNVNRYAFSSTGYYNYVVREGSAMQKVANLPSKRIEILINNIENVRRIIPESQLDLLRYGIIYSTYVNSLLSHSSYLKKGEIQYLKVLLNDMRWKELRYVSVKNKCKLYAKGVFFILRTLICQLKWILNI